MEIIFNREVSTCVQTVIWVIFFSIFLYFTHSLITSPGENEIMADKGFAKVYLSEVGDSSRPHWMLTNSTEYAQAIQKKLNVTANSGNTRF